MSPKNPTRSKAVIRAGGIGLVVVCVAAAAMLIAARKPTQPTDMTATEVQPNASAAEQPMVKTPKAPVKQMPAKKMAASKTPAASAPPARTVAMEDTPMPKAPVEESAPKAAAQEPAAVTITGCLDRDDETFRLKDTAGADAPKARSWKSGFIKKGSASIEVVDAANRLKLSSHVGQRVSITGMLADREMHGRSLQRVAGSCD